MEYKEEGLINKYTLLKNDGSEIDPGAEYFILRLDDGQSDEIHKKACKKAILVYADEIKDHLPKLYKDLIDKYS